jgi:hypothetical protein
MSISSSLPRPLVAGLLTCAAAVGAGFAAAPAGAVIGGTPVDPATVPWLANVQGCGGTLVAPDRVLTAAHCVAGKTLQEVGDVVVAGAPRRVAGLTLHPQWRTANGDNVLDDVALAVLAEPVAGVAPVPLGGAPADRLTILGAGYSHAPGRGSEADNFHSILRQATLRPLSDAACAAKFRRTRGNGGERFDAARMLCATDVDGRRPLSSGCNGDSGGPLYAGTAVAPRLFGVVSWGGTDCGDRHYPSVFADAARYRGFVANPAPVLAPMPAGPAVMSGSPRVGGTLTCAVPAFTNAPTSVDVAWMRQAYSPAVVVGRRATYRLRRADAGRRMSCVVQGSNDGGFSRSFSTVTRIPR